MNSRTIRRSNPSSPSLSPQATFGSRPVSASISSRNDLESLHLTLGNDGGDVEDYSDLVGEDDEDPFRGKVDSLRVSLLLSPIYTQQLTSLRTTAVQPLSETHPPSERSVRFVSRQLASLITTASFAIPTHQIIRTRCSSLGRPVKSASRQGECV